MKLGSIFYAISVTTIFLFILFSVRYIVNTNKIYIDYEERVDPVQIFWQMDVSDSSLRVKEPLYLKDNYFIAKNQLHKLIKDSVYINEISDDSVSKPGSIMNIKPPYILWKDAKSDTIKVFKSDYTYKFVRQHI